jgi:Flp pilus assembly protein TadB
MSDEEGLPHARPVDATAVTERPTPWLPARSVLLNLLSIFVGGGLFWFLVDRARAPLWVAFVAYAVMFTMGSLAIRFIRNARAERIRE